MVLPIYFTGVNLSKQMNKCQVDKPCLLLACLFLAYLSVPAGAGSATESEFKAGLERILQTTWEGYKVLFISEQGRVIRPEDQADSISEGQAYAMLRAVWSDDQATFERCYGWTEANLSRRQQKGDELLAWRWGKNSSGQWQVLDWNSASDADLDYALSLILAHRKWGRASPGLPDYLVKARAVLKDILDKETVTDPWGRLWITPGSWIKPGLPLLLNPSYFSPAWYRLFYQLTNDRRWLQLVDSAYWALEKLEGQLGGVKGRGLIPDWCILVGPDSFEAAPDQSSNYGWDAVRVPWRIAMDRLWFGQARSKDFLEKTILNFFQPRWRLSPKLAAVYTYQGKPAVDYESPVLYAGVLAAAMVGDQPEWARKMAEKIVLNLKLGKKGAFFCRPNDYYSNNWAWFGLATYCGWIKP